MSRNDYMLLASALLHLVKYILYITIFFLLLFFSEKIFEMKNFIFNYTKIFFNVLNLFSELFITFFVLLSLQLLIKFFFTIKALPILKLKIIFY